MKHAIRRPSLPVVLDAGYVEIPDAAHGVTIQRAERIKALLDEHLASAEHEPARALAGDG
jgi:pimeloyl-ACP methyl ester carboxylesterase